jgi:Tol biopolymer transport system component
MNKICLLLLLFFTVLFSDSPLIDRHHTMRLDNFSIHYPRQYEMYAHEVGRILERLYPLYQKKYNIVLPDETDVIISRDYYNSWAAAVQNTISIGIEPMDFNLRGTSNWLENVVAHEYAHIASISTSFKMPAWMPYIQFGSFSHPNEAEQFNGLYIYPSDILPPWLFEGIAQYESDVFGGDSWDSHRDMILRSRILSDSLISWDHMSVFKGRGDEYELVYNHGFSLVKYISENYGKEKIESMLRASTKFGRVNFDRSIEEVLGITGENLYDNWKAYLSEKYTQQIESLGDTTEARQITEKGWNNFYPRFSRDGKRLFFLANPGNDAFGQQLYSHAMDSFYDTTYAGDTVFNRMESPLLTTAYDLHGDSLAVFSSRYSITSKKPHNRGGGRYSDLYELVLTPHEEDVESQSHRDLHRVTENMDLFAPSYSPGRDTIAAALHEDGKSFFVLLERESGEILRRIPSHAADSGILRAVFSTQWSPAGNAVAFDYIDRDNRTVAWYDIENDSLFILEENEADFRDPFFSADGAALYYSSDETGIFNIYRYSLENNTSTQITNVGIGAFSPAVNADETQLAYAGYTADGYKIFLMDSLQHTSYESFETGTETALNYSFDTSGVFDAPYSEGRTNYSALPRRPLVIPTLLNESVITEHDDIYSGISTFKYGAIATVMDPLSWTNRGNMLTAFYLSESIFRQIRNAVFFQSYNRSMNKKIAYDLGLSYETGILPVDINLFYFFRNIPATSEFVHDFSGRDEREETDVSIQPSLLELKLSHSLGNVFTGTVFSNYLNQQNQLNISQAEDGDQYLRLKVGSIFRSGFLVSMLQRPYTQQSSISPYGVAMRLQYDYALGRFVDEERFITVENGRIKSNLNTYNYHTFSGKLRSAQPSFLLPDVDAEIDMGATYVRIPEGTQNTIDSLKDNALGSNYSGGFPEFFQPVLTVPGYTFSYRADSTEYELRDEYGTVYDTVVFYDDSLLFSDNILLNASLSYRFPLWPGKSIDKKIGFLYFDQLFGSVNFGGALAAGGYTDLKNTTRDDILLHLGTEVRLKSIAFNGFPLAASFRWDRGLDKPAPVGGDRFTFTVGFQFDNWTIITEPDGSTERFNYLRTLSASPVRTAP